MSRSRTSTRLLSTVCPARVRRTLLSAAGVLGLTLVTAFSVAAQQRVITGRVTDATTGKGLPGAEVFLPIGRGGSRATFGAVAGDKGLFRVRVPAGPVTLAVRLLGYKRQDIAVPANQSTVQVALAIDVLNLEQIVVTGQATGVQRRNLPNAVTTVNAKELDVAPAASVESQLAGKVAGASISSNSGAPGGGNQVDLRGVSTIIGSSDPLYVVDGVIVSDATIESGANSITGASSGISSNQDNSANRIADLNPADIAKIEVLKGASAAAIYGSKANNGVILITTKRGTPGQTRYSLTQRFGVSALSKELGTRQFNDVQTAVAAFGQAAAAFFGPDGKPLATYDHEREIAGRKPLSSETDLSISGGTDRTLYYISGLYNNDQGIVNGTYAGKQSLMINVDQTVNDRLHFGLKTNALHTDDDRGFTNNDNSSTAYFLTLLGTPNFVDLRRQPGGTYPVNPFQPSNPLQTAALAKNREDVYRFIGSLTGSWDVVSSETQSLKVNFLGGGDVFAQKNVVYSPEDLQFEPLDGFPGTSVLSNSLDQNLNLNLNAAHTYDPWEGTAVATTSLGLQYEYEYLDVSRALTRDLLPGQQDAGAGTQVTAQETRSESKDLGAFFQEQLLFSDRLLLLGGVRGDRSSTDADVQRWFYYPKAAASYRWTVQRGPFDEIKFRGAWGQSGNQPKYGQKFNSLNGGRLSSLQTLRLGSTTAASDLRPERETEIEGGLDVQLFHSRASVELTGYRKVVHDLLLSRALPPSTGFSTAIYNSTGSLDTKGVEAALSAELLRTRNFDWTTHVTFNHTRSMVDSLDVPPFNSPSGGFGTSLGAGRIEQGKSATQIVGRDTITQVDDPRCLAYLNVEPGSGRCTPGTRIVTQIGDATPKFQMGFVNSFRLGDLSLAANVDWQHGGNVVNLTGFLLDANQNTADYDAPCHLSGCQPGETMGQYRNSIYPGRTSTVWVEDASYVKLRELDLSYQVPQRFLQAHILGGGISFLRIDLSGRNLLTFTGYSGYDPEVNNFGAQAIRTNIDVAPYPPSRTFWLSVDVGF